MTARLTRLRALVERHETLIAVALGTLYAAVYGGLSLLRHWTFHSTASDLGVFDQVLWNTLHGRFMESTMSLLQCRPHSFFGDHFSPILLAIVPFYAVFPQRETLVVLQTVALALGAWPIYLMARRFVPTAVERLVWVLAYVLSAPLAWVSLYDFHEVAFLPLPLGLAMYFLATRRTVPLLLCLLGSFLVKEEVTLIGVGFGVALLLQRRRRAGALVIVASVAAFVVILKLVIPTFAGVDAYQYLTRYESLGRNELEIARTLVLDPLRALGALAKGDVGSKALFILSLFGPGLGLALRSRWALLPAVPPIGYLVLADYPGMHTHHNQYGAPLIPLALGASILGFAGLAEPLRRRLAPVVVLSTLALALALGAVPFTPGFEDAYLRGTADRPSSGQSMLVREPRYESFLAALAAIPADASVASRDYLTTQIAERRFLSILSGLDPCDAEFVILDFADPSVNRDPGRHRAEVEALKSRGYREIASGEGLSLLRR